MRAALIIVDPMLAHDTTRGKRLQLAAFFLVGRIEVDDGAGGLEAAARRVIEPLFLPFDVVAQLL